MKFGWYVEHRHRMAGRRPVRRHCNNPTQEMTGPERGRILGSEKLPLADTGRLIGFSHVLHPEHGFSL